MKPAIFIIIMTVLLGSCATIHPFPLIDAAEKGQIERVKALLEAGADVNAKGENSWTALMVAVLGGNTEAVQVLLDAEADVNAKAKDGRIALMWAEDSGHNEIVEILKKAGAKE